MWTINYIVEAEPINSRKNYQVLILTRCGAVGVLSLVKIVHSPTSKLKCGMYAAAAAAAVVVACHFRQSSVGSKWRILLRAAATTHHFERYTAPCCVVLCCVIEVLFLIDLFCFGFMFLSSTRVARFFLNNDAY